MTTGDNWEELLPRASAVFLAVDLDPMLIALGDSLAEVEARSRVFRLLKILNETDKLFAAVVSDRSMPYVSARVPCRGVALLANGGLEICAPGLEFVHPGALTHQKALQALIHHLDYALCKFAGVWIEPQRYTTRIDYRNLTPEKTPDLLQVIQGCLKDFAPSFVAVQRDAALEIRPRVAWSRGDALQCVRRRAGLEHLPSICIGDAMGDQTFFLQGSNSANFPLSCRTAERLMLYQTVEGVLSRLLVALSSKGDPRGSSTQTAPALAAG